MLDRELKDLCKENFIYNRDTGAFKIIKKTNNRVELGNVAGSKGINGYIRISIRGVRYYAHRLAFLLENDYLPKYIDHINGKRDDNRIINLREATNSQNLRNRGVQKNNTSGYKGVVYNKRAGKWQSTIEVNYTTKYLGIFHCRHDAAKAYNLAARMYHGEFAYTNKIIES